MSLPSEILVDQLRPLPSLAVAFSGGVDSGLLLSLAVEALGNRVTAVTATSPIHPRREILAAIDLAGRLGCRHLLLRSREMETPEFIANSAERCYICKRGLLQQIRTAAAERGIAHLAHGANIDDQGDYRPGMQAAAEMDVLAPLVAAGMTKSDIRMLARERGLPNWNRPAMACLATRIPHDTPITPSLLTRIEKAEDYLQALGFSAPRVRCHGDMARIECRGEDITRMLASDARTRVSRQLKQFGFRLVTLDLEGYRQGSMNPPDPPNAS